MNAITLPDLDSETLDALAADYVREEYGIEDTDEADYFDGYEADNFLSEFASLGLLLADHLGELPTDANGSRIQFAVDAMPASEDLGGFFIGFSVPNHPGQYLSVNRSESDAITDRDATDYAAFRDMLGVLADEVTALVTSWNTIFAAN